MSLNQNGAIAACVRERFRGCVRARLQPCRKRNPFPTALAAESSYSLQNPLRLVSKISNFSPRAARHAMNYDGGCVRRGEQKLMKGQGSNLRTPASHRPPAWAIPGRMLIATLAIRTSPNPSRINTNSISNRDRTAIRLVPASRILHRPIPVASHRSTAALIGASAIRNRRNLCGINYIEFSNRHRMHELAPVVHGAPVTGHRSPVTALIGSPVIRIRPNSFIFRWNLNSNRHKTTPDSASPVTGHRSLVTSPTARATPL